MGQVAALRLTRQITTLEISNYEKHSLNAFVHENDY